MNESVGVVGLGLLGSAIAERLQKSGHEVCGFDLLAPENSGARICCDAGEVFSECLTVIFSLPASEISAAVVAEVSDQLRPGQVIVDTTTGAPDQMIEIARELGGRNVAYVEANVAGSSLQLRRGEAALLVAGDEEIAEKLDDLFAALSSRVFFLGPVGSASRFKLVHNLVLGLHRAVLAEGLEFAETLGFDARQTLAILPQTPAASAVMATKGKRMAEGNYDKPEARLSQHLKDVRLMLAEAERAGLQLPLTAQHRELLEKVESLGFGGSDNSAIREAFRTGSCE